MLSVAVAVQMFQYINKYNFLNNYSQLVQAGGSSQCHPAGEDKLERECLVVIQDTRADTKGQRFGAKNRQHSLLLFIKDPQICLCLFLSSSSLLFSCYYLCLPTFFFFLSFLLSLHVLDVVLFKRTRQRSSSCWLQMTGIHCLSAPFRPGFTICLIEALILKESQLFSIFFKPHCCHWNIIWLFTVLQTFSFTDNFTDLQKKKRYSQKDVYFMFLWSYFVTFIDMLLLLGIH